MNCSKMEAFRRKACCFIVAKIISSNYMLHLFEIACFCSKAWACGLALIAGFFLIIRAPGIEPLSELFFAGLFVRKKSEWRKPARAPKK
jgi:hypothetical protein